MMNARQKMFCMLLRYNYFQFTAAVGTNAANSGGQAAPLSSAGRILKLRVCVSRDNINRVVSFKVYHLSSFSGIRISKKICIGVYPFVFLLLGYGLFYSLLGLPPLTLYNYWNKPIDNYFKEFLSSAHLDLLAKLSDGIFLCISGVLHSKFCYDNFPVWCSEA
jgi:hypothetical protein